MVRARQVAVGTKGKLQDPVDQSDQDLEGVRCLQKRLPKYGFTSRIASVTSQVTLSELDSIDEKGNKYRSLKIKWDYKKSNSEGESISSGQITKPVVLGGNRSIKWCQGSNSFCRRDN